VDYEIDDDDNDDDEERWSGLRRDYEGIVKEININEE
jgi:hypothetical protein